MDLANEACKPVGPNDRLDDKKAKGLLKDVPGWNLKDGSLERDFRFSDFTGSMAFVNTVALVAESEDHHPDLCVSYNKVHLTLTTHGIKGLSRNDFIMAAKINALE